MTPKERLLFLAIKLRENADNPTGMKFDLRVWLSGNTIDCGTTGCAVGLAMLLPEFQAEGLHGTATPLFDYSSAWGATTKFFGLTEWEALTLFQPDHYQKTKGAEAEHLVADRIWDFAKFYMKDHV